MYTWYIPDVINLWLFFHFVLCCNACVFTHHVDSNTQHHNIHLKQNIQSSRVTQNRSEHLCHCYTKRRLGWHQFSQPSFCMTPTTDVYYMLSSQITLYSRGHTKKKNHWLGWCQPNLFWYNNNDVNILVWRVVWHSHTQVSVQNSGPIVLH